MYLFCIQCSSMKEHFLFTLAAAEWGNNSEIVMMIIAALAAIGLGIQIHQTNKSIKEQTIAVKQNEESLEMTQKMLENQEQDLKDTRAELRENRTEFKRQSSAQETQSAMHLKEVQINIISLKIGHLIEKKKTLNNDVDYRTKDYIVLQKEISILRNADIHDKNTDPILKFEFNELLQKMKNKDSRVREIDVLHALIEIKKSAKKNQSKTILEDNQKIEDLDKDLESFQIELDKLSAELIDLSESMPKELLKPSQVQA